MEQLRAWEALCRGPSPVDRSPIERSAITPSPMSRRADDVDDDDLPPRKRAATQDDKVGEEEEGKAGGGEGRQVEAESKGEGEEGPIL